MTPNPIYQEQFDTLKCGVLIPTYNNGNTLKRVLKKVLRYTSNVIVVNDGSTDGTRSILEQFESIKVIAQPINKGKGSALKTGFRIAAQEGYSYVISMDSDGQHFPDDLPVFLDALASRHPEEKELLVIGSRKMNHPSVPEKSSFGNRCSSFWFWVETGIQLKDTQCGYRLYPVSLVNSLNLCTTRFELEIEVIVKAAWKGAEVKNLPVKVLYDPEERVTHFRPFQDVARITLLNIWFVGVAFFQVYPRRLMDRFWKGKEKKITSTEFTDQKVPLE